MIKFQQMKVRHHTKARSLSGARIGMMLGLFLMVTLIGAACTGGGSHVLLAEYNRDFEAEIFLAQLGDDDSEWQSLAEDVSPTFILLGTGTELATFVPGTNNILLWYEHRDDFVLAQMQIGDDDATEILESNDSFFATFSDDPFAVYIQERVDSGARCYVAFEDEETERLARADNCFIFSGGVIFAEQDDEELTVTVMDLDGDNETVVLDGVEDVPFYRWNEDLSLIAYVQRDRDESQLFLVERGEEEAVEIGDEVFAIFNVGFLSDGESLFYVSQEDEDEDMALFLSTVEDALAEEVTISRVQGAPDDDYLAYVAGDEREEALFVYSLGDDESIDVAEEEEIVNFRFVDTDPARLLVSVRDGDEFTLLSANVDGSEPVELFADNDFVPRTVYFAEDASQVALLVEDEDGLTSLYVSPVDSEEGYFLIEEWTSIRLHNMTDNQLIFQGFEDRGDDVRLYSITLEDGADEIELDELDEFGNFRGVFFSANGRSVLYTAVEEGLDESEVRQVPVDGEENPETLYKDVVLLDVQWDGASPLQGMQVASP